MPLGFGAYLIKNVMHMVVEKDSHGNLYSRMSKLLLLSGWLYEEGAILGKLWKDKLSSVLQVYEREINQKKDFVEYWMNQAKDRLRQYNGEPESFQIYILKTDLEMLWGLNLDKYKKIADTKLDQSKAQEFFQMAELSFLEGIMFGNLYPDIVEKMLENTYENVDSNQWNQARKAGITLSTSTPYTSVKDKEKEAVDLAHDYVTKYHPTLVNALGL